MKKVIRIKIEKENSKNTLSDYSSPFDIENTSKVSEVKTQVKNTLSFPSELVKEYFYYGSKELKDDQVLDKEGPFEYKLVIK